MKRVITIIIILIILVAGIYGYVYYRLNRNQTDLQVIPTTANNFPSSVIPNSASSSTDFPVSPSTQPGQTNQINTANTTVNTTDKLAKITAGPIAGASLVTIVNKKIASSTVWYAEKETGNLFSFNPASGELTPVSNTTIPYVSEAYFGKFGNDPRIILRYTKDSKVENFLAKLVNQSYATGTSPSSIKQLGGLILNPSLNQIAISPNKDRYFSLIATTLGSASFINDFSGVKQDQLAYVSAHPRWNISWPAENIVVFQSAPLANSPGMIFFYNPTTKSFQKKLSGLNGLTALVSPDGQKILYGYNDNNQNLILKLKYLNKALDTQIGVVTLPEKCVWSTNSASIFCAVPNKLSPDSYPDNWYMGLTSFTDGFWQINATTGETKMVFNPENMGSSQKIDGTNLFLTAKEDKLFFTNKKDGSLWMLNLTDNI